MKGKNRIPWLISFLFLFLVSFSTFAYKVFVQPANSGKTSFLYIKSTSDLQTGIDSLEKMKINNLRLFRIMAQVSNLSERKISGRYKIQTGESIFSIFKKVYNQRQEPVVLTFINVRFLPKLASLLSKKLEVDSAGFMFLMTNNKYLSQYNSDSLNSISIFIPNTYELYWNTSDSQIIAKMYNEYQKFWNEDRMQKAKNLNLSPKEVSIMASIVQEETNYKEEMDLIAGVYLNRLQKGMLLQADPTARFAVGNFDIRRIGYSYLSIDSPYNTYKYKGLPPGPICMPNATTIDKVLDYKSHDYLFFCAKPDNTGQHAFAKTYKEHQKNAKAYHKYLDRRNINI
jgi:UPF0755 protein